MKFYICKLAAVVLFLFAGSASAVEFTKEELELVKDACLAGSNFEFKTEADGSISVKNLEGKGKLSIGKKEVTTVDLPDADKKEEFKEIRACIKGYLTDSSAKKRSPNQIAIFQEPVNIHKALEPGKLNTFLLKCL